MKNNDIPRLDKGTYLPHDFYNDDYLKAVEKRELKAKRRHDWAIASFGTIGGAIAGFITSLITLKLQGLL